MTSSRRTAFAPLLIEFRLTTKPRSTVTVASFVEARSPPVGRVSVAKRHAACYHPPKGVQAKEIAMRKGAIVRKTSETSIEVGLDLNGSGLADIATGIGFFDHMLDQLARHSLVDISVRAEGDRHIDDHHTVEDVGIALGQALMKALGDKRGLTRYADCLLPMDETLTRVALDVSGRPFLVFRTEFPTEKIGAFDTELVREFFQAFAGNAGLTLHIETLYGSNSHHIAESCFKGVARALRAAIAIDSRQAERVPSTKGAL
jgi:imidazoleglycerol-phosphate dehydratase